MLEDESETVTAQGTEFVVVECAQQEPFEADFAACDGQYSGQAIQEGRLARTALSHDGHDLTLADCNGRAPDGVRLPIKEVDSSGRQDF
ncbi:hypothetical protein GCM10010317_013030 [Streptomyces mirabilis]|nr:hypothetical protein GCM10010317_013030 [Streptomyces mirabilis]